jgi:PAS domain-containing protein
MVGQSITRLFPADRQHEEPEILERIRRGENLRQYETVRRRKDGSTIDVSITVSAIKDAAGRIIGASKVARDITERKKAEAARRLSDERFQVASEDHALKREFYDELRSNPAIIEFLESGSLDGLWYWDLEHPENEWMSPRFWSVLGYDPQTKQHRSAEWQDIIFPDDLAVAMDNLAKHCADPDIPMTRSYAIGIRMVLRCGSAAEVWPFAMPRASRCALSVRTTR